VDAANYKGRLRPENLDGAEQVNFLAALLKRAHAVCLSHLTHGGSTLHSTNWGTPSINQLGPMIQHPAAYKCPLKAVLAMNFSGDQAGLLLASTGPGRPGSMNASLPLAWQAALHKQCGILSCAAERCSSERPSSVLASMCPCTVASSHASAAAWQAKPAEARLANIYLGTQSNAIKCQLGCGGCAASIA
jgi:hypothetical protein